MATRIGVIRKDRLADTAFYHYRLGILGACLAGLAATFT